MDLKPLHATERTGVVSWPASPSDLDDIHVKLSDITAEQWSAIAQQSKLHHPQDTKLIDDGARRRLKELDLVDESAEQLFTFRLSSTHRIWGLKTPDGEYHVLWNDPHHCVYPYSRDPADRSRRKKRAKKRQS